MKGAKDERQEAESRLQGEGSTGGAEERQGVVGAVGAVSGPSKPDLELEAATSGTGYGCRSENALCGGRPVSFLVPRGDSGAGSV